jgi:hypothetical protein
MACGLGSGVMSADPVKRWAPRRAGLGVSTLQDRFVAFVELRFDRIVSSVCGGTRLGCGGGFCWSGPRTGC